MTDSPRKWVRAASDRLVPLFRSRGRIALYILLGSPISFALGIALGGPALPLIQALVIFPLFCGVLGRDEWRKALFSMLLWAASTAACGIFVSSLAPEFTQERILYAEAYQSEMFEWIATGEGREGDIALFLPEHALHLALFSVLALASCGFLGLVMGAALLNYMSFYVGTLLLQGRDLNPLLLIAWPPWAAFRVVAFILIATSISAWVLNRLRFGRTTLNRFPRYLIYGGVFLAADIASKWALAPYWREWLRSLVEF